MTVLPKVLSFALLQHQVLAQDHTSNNLAELFEEFKTQFGKKYEGAAKELERFKVFAENVERARKMQMLDASAKYGHLSPMADLSEAEYSRLNNLPVTQKVLDDHAVAAEKSTHAVALRGIPTSGNFDWREKGAVNEVKNQAQCGSCWSFATVANIEGNNFITNGALVSLSEQELVDCDVMDNGCNGGLPANAYKDLIGESMGLELESEYPYTAEEGYCAAKKNLEKVYLSSWVPIGSSETEMAQALVKYGPLAIGINAGPMQMYMGGIADPLFCNPAALDHGVAIVAFGEERGREYWVIRNSWGNMWGEDGYYRIVRGKGKCGLNRMVTSAIVAPSTKKALPSPKQQELYV